MLYVGDLIDLMAAFPGREWRMKDLINYCRKGRRITPTQRRAIAIAVFRAIRALEGTGVIAIKRSPVRGSYAIYVWR